MHEDQCKVEQDVLEWNGLEASTTGIPMRGMCVVDFTDKPKPKQLLERPIIFKVK